MTQPNQNIHRSTKNMMWNNFLGGIAWGIGSTIGVAIILAILGFILKRIDVVPIVGHFASQVNLYTQKHAK